MFIAIKTDDGRIKGKISFYCKVLHVSRQAFNKYLKTKDAPWKYQALADAMTIPDVKACGHTSKRNYFMGAMTPPIPQLSPSRRTLNNYAIYFAKPS